MLNHPVLVLNQNYEPIHVCQVRRAILLCYQGKAEMLEDGLGLLHTVRLSIPMPSVIRLQHHVRRPRPRHKLTRWEIFHRDDFSCQYCGKKAQPLTIDHVVPRFQGGRHSWENLVAACVPCNRHKAGRTPEQANMKLLKKPSMPEGRPLVVVSHRYQERMHIWQKYLPDKV
ncbi:HNH endonuclease [Dehalogenimonas sp. 4OHTPN]|uniref:HNH endonuclease n=1 Tax=Dehalogenimonas sp. 4OHTPN TaxID=3166643 RepID=A0AAU8G9T0_9CHLR